MLPPVNHHSQHRSHRACAGTKSNNSKVEQCDLADHDRLGCCIQVRERKSPSRERPATDIIWTVSGRSLELSLITFPLLASLRWPCYPRFSVSPLPRPALAPPSTPAPQRRTIPGPLRSSSAPPGRNMPLTMCRCENNKTPTRTAVRRQEVNPSTVQRLACLNIVWTTFLLGGTEMLSGAAVPAWEARREWWRYEKR